MKDNDRFPFYHLVPKDLIANLIFRQKLIQLGAESKDAAYEIKIMCKRDLLFYTNSFIMSIDPRPTAAYPATPFITYNFQDEAMTTIDEILGYEDFLNDKSRTMGASYICLIVFEHKWHFFDLQLFLMVSRNEAYVDGESKSLFWKVDFIHRNQPMWLLPTGRWLGDKDPGRTHKPIKLVNADNGSIISGEATTPDVGAGDRRTAVLLDEFPRFKNGKDVLASTQAVTHCRIFNGTPNGQDEGFYAMRCTDIIKLEFHWHRHPVYSKGLYTIHPDGEKEIYDTEWHRLNPGYKFNLDTHFETAFRFRSPWYDRECKRSPSKQLIAQELDINYSGSDHQAFDTVVIAGHKKLYCREPIKRGRFIINQNDRVDKFVEDVNGPWKLWFEPDAYGRPPRGAPSSIGIDVAGGTGYSSAVMSVMNRNTGEKIAEFVSAYTPPYKLAVEANAVGYWFSDRSGRPAYLKWDAYGVGSQFRDPLLKLGYGNIYYKKHDKRIGKNVTDQPGFYAKGDDKNDLLGSYASKLTEGIFINPSEEALDECLQYVIVQGGDWMHRSTVKSDNPHSGKKTHGDIVIADALACSTMEDTSKSVTPLIDEAPVRSLAYRRERRRLAEANKELW